MGLDNQEEWKRVYILAHSQTDGMTTETVELSALFIAIKNRRIPVEENLLAMISKRRMERAFGPQPS